MKSNIENRLLKLLGRKRYVPSTNYELLAQLKLGTKSAGQLQETLDRLEHEGRIARIKSARYILPTEADLVPRTHRINRHGKGFLIPDDEAIPEIAVPASRTATAFHEDHVLVRLDVSHASDVADKTTGSVIRVLERNRSQIVGTLKKSQRFLYVVPDDPRIPHDIYVPQPRDVGRPVRQGDKVVVELGEWHSRHHNPEGEIIEVLGPPTKEGVDMLGVLRQYDLPLRFPRKVLQEVKVMGTTVTARDRKGRTDCRTHDVITIDPADAKDFDDAFYLKQLEDGNWRLWVHIADVSHYVKPGSELDREARTRGNSTYLVDRVIPMLPEALSNELCSLKPEVDRLTKCVEFTVSQKGNVLSSKCYSAVIHSKRRFAYEDAMAVITKGRGADSVETMIVEASRLAQKIRKLRFRAGSLELDFPETKIRLDSHGRVDRIEKVDNDASHQLIEEFMLLANEAVAGRLMRQRKPTIYRIHEPPNEDRLHDYRQDVLSHHVPCGNLTNPNEVRKLMRRLDKLPIGRPLKIGFLRSLMRARYSVQPLGHYGLAKAKYAHFTSPIRRYADLVVHRSMFERRRLDLQSLKRTADHISTTERNSADAERDSKDVKLHAYLEAQIQSDSRDRYSAIVTDLRNFGFFVDVTDLGMSGLVPLSTLTDDFYELDPNRNEIRGRRRRSNIVRLGDTVQVEVASVDRFKKQVDFRIASQEAATSKRKHRSARKKCRSSSGEALDHGSNAKPRANSKKSSGQRSTRSNSKPRRKTSHHTADPKRQRRRANRKA